MYYLEPAATMMALVPVKWSLADSELDGDLKHRLKILIHLKALAQPAVKGQGGVQTD